jgi:hypothetical protein
MAADAQAYQLLVLQRSVGGGCLDADGDGECDADDNCPQVANADQADADSDGLGDACRNDPDNDVDGDGICGDVDTCPRDAQNDADHDGICGDVDLCPNDAANDADGDGVCGDVDNCPITPNPDQADSNGINDGDGIGDACENRAPTANDDSAGTYSGAPVTVTVLLNDSDPDGDSLAVTGVSGNTANATVTLNLDGTVTYAPVDGFAGTETFTYTIGDGKGGTDSATVTIDVAKRLASVTAVTGTKVYGSSDPSLEPTASGFLAADAIAVSGSRDAGETVGSYATHGSAADPKLVNYDVTYTDGVLTITKKSATVTAVTASKVYGAADPSLTPLAVGFLPADDVTVSGARDAGEAVGNYATHGFAAGSALDNYDVSYTDGELTITKKTATVTAVTDAKVYGSADPSLVPTAVGFQAADGITVTGSRDAGENVGNYATHGAATGGALANYDVTYVDGELAITRKPATVTAVTDTKVYGSADPSLVHSAAGFLPADGITVTGSRAAGENVGSYATHGAAAGGALGNYAVTYVDGLLTITKATLTVTAPTLSLHYGAPVPVLTPSYAGFVAGDTAASLTPQATCSSAYTPTTPVGAIPTTCSGAASPNYSIGYVGGTLTVTNTAPVCDLAAASILTIWPPNHKWVPVTVVGVTDADGDALSIAITSIYQDEPTNSYGDGNTPIDGQINGSTALVRAERQGKKDGRVYHISFTATDPAGASCTGKVTTCVPHDQGRFRDDDDHDRRWDRKKGRKSKSVGCTDGGPLFNSLVATPRTKPDHDPKGCKDDGHDHDKQDRDDWDRENPKSKGGKK